MLSYLTDLQLKDFEVGSPKWFQVQRDIIKSRPLVRICYETWYRKFIKAESTVPQQNKGIILELGSGASYLKEMKKDVVTSDIFPGVADHVFRAESIPFSDNSVRAIFMSHSFHHIPNIELFFKDASRVLVPGGLIFIVEVAHTPMARFFFSKCCKDEDYDDKAKSWDFKQTHAMNDANQALSWIIFSRDYNEFLKKFPQLRLEKKEYLPWLGYLLSGGVTRKNFIPNILSPFIQFVELLSKPVAQLTSLHWSLILRKSS